MARHTKQINRGRASPEAAKSGWRSATPVDLTARFMALVAPCAFFDNSVVVMEVASQLNHVLASFWMYCTGY